MPINVVGNSSNLSQNKIDTSFFVQEPYLRTNYIESKLEENIGKKNQFRNKNLPDPISTREAASKRYVDNIFKNDIDFKDVKLKNTKFGKINYQPTVNEHLTPKIYADDAINETTLVRNNKDNNFNKYNFTNINKFTLKTQAINDDHVIFRAYVVLFHQEDERI